MRVGARAGERPDSIWRPLFSGPRRGRAARLARRALGAADRARRDRARASSPRSAPRSPRISAALDHAYNVAAWPRGHASGGGPPARVSICIPARDEQADSIERAVRAALASQSRGRRGPRVRRSLPSDDTGAILARLAAVRGAPARRSAPRRSPPAGSASRTRATRLARAARGERSRLLGRRRRDRARRARPAPRPLRASIERLVRDRDAAPAHRQRGRGARAPAAPRDLHELVPAPAHLALAQISRFLAANGQVLSIERERARGDRRLRGDPRRSRRRHGALPRAQARAGGASRSSTAR